MIWLKLDVEYIEVIIYIKDWLKIDTLLVWQGDC